MPWKPLEGDLFPSLGWQVIDWITENLAQPDAGLEPGPFLLYPEQEEFVLNFYRINPDTGRRTYRRGVLSRPRGWGKSPFAAALMAVEGLGPVIFDGWDADGQPVGKPWSEVRTPLVQVAATSETQTRNTFSALQEMMEGPVVDNYRGVEILGDRINLPSGRMEMVTTSARTIKGARADFCVLDQTEEWVSSNGGQRLHQVIDANTAKRGGAYLETPNAFIPGENSVAEESASYWSMIQEGKAVADGLYYDHREAPGDTDVTDRESLTLGLRIAYGDASQHPDGCLIHDPACPPGHADLEARIQSFWDLTKDPQVARADYLNQVVAASDSWMTRPELTAVVDVEKIVSPDDPITVGFDGSRGRAKGIADATALIGCRVSDAHLFVLDVWEQPRNATDWYVPVAEVDARVREVFEQYTVVGFYADPNGWTSQVSEWEAKYGKKLRVHAKRDAPMSYWPKGKDGNVPRLLEELRSAIVNGDCSLDGSTVLIRHMLNARRRRTRSGYLLYKSYPDSPDKIDAAYAAVMAWKARLDAVSAGAGRARRQIPARRRTAVIR
ncbi:terminase [Brachybacterium sp. UMB0905]|uniref:terminase n=1 Tax=Brachybacterium sp. UMB0905 TaxID=2069310 RepID=UPI000C80632D|nr:terminase [Brachybacterium sp. UMB0905]PMC76399.1 terminase [Brachybacterium sp. UMB0905]